MSWLARPLQVDVLPSALVPRKVHHPKNADFTINSCLACLSLWAFCPVSHSSLLLSCICPSSGASASMHHGGGVVTHRDQGGGVECFCCGGLESCFRCEGQESCFCCGDLESCL